ncbi:hypothetical protein ABVN23_29185 [Pseudomonas fluorescens]|jgi:hypothetical protein|uniref:hypothetical protein n=1 Tax=Pseudomonas TaxID=286 RepID=UPI0004841C69|nr:hypothetical protein [Pseudomonas sp. Pse1]
MNTRAPSSWLILLALSLAFSAGCSSKKPSTQYASASNCYAKAVPTVGEGGLAWGSSLGVARSKSMNNCIRYAGRSGGTPNTCKVVLAQCKR